MPAPSLALRAAAALELRKRGVRLDLSPTKNRPADLGRYLGDPWAYASDIFGLTLTDQQSSALELMEKYDRVLIRSGNNLGKTYLLGLYGVYYLDIVGRQIDPETGKSLGARVLLPGPDHGTIFATVYSKMLIMAERAQGRGFAMPGRRSDNSVLWRVRPEYEVEAFSPPKNVRQAVAHTASGRHQIHQIALIEEGPGTEERVWRATEGMCSSRGNKIVSSYNPTEASGPCYERERTGNYRVLVLDAFSHPNVQRRQIVVPGAVDPLVIDGRVRQCRDRGAFPEVQPEAAFGDFVYAPPTKEALLLGEVLERGPRTDGILGHPDFQPRVWRPQGSFQAQVLGQYPSTEDHGLFSPGAWDAAVERWKAGRDPVAPPDRVGFDPAREGNDDACACPSWGEDAEDLLRAQAAAEFSRAAPVLAILRETRRVRVGEIRVFPKGKGFEMAQAAAAAFPRSSWNVDDGGVGVSALDYARGTFGLQVFSVSFGGAPPERLPGEYYCDNVRAALYVRAAMLVAAGLVDVPDDPILRQEIMAQQILPSSRVVEEVGAQGFSTKERKESVRLLEKSEIRKRIGRSPDRADAFVLSLWKPARQDRWGFV